MGGGWVTNARAAVRESARDVRPRASCVARCEQLSELYAVVLGLGALSVKPDGPTDRDRRELELYDRGHARERGGPRPGEARILRAHQPLGRRDHPVGTVDKRRRRGSPTPVGRGPIVCQVAPPSLGRGNCTVAGFLSSASITRANVASELEKKAGGITRPGRGVCAAAGSARAAHVRPPSRVTATRSLSGPPTIQPSCASRNTIRPANGAARARQCAPPSEVP